MTWLQRYRLSKYFRNSMWVLPVVGMAVALVSVRWLHWLERMMAWELPVDPAAALTVMGTLAASMFTFLVFVCSALLVSIQLASAQLTPRYIALVLQNRTTRLSLMLFTFTFTFTLAALVRIKGSVPSLTAYIAVYSCLLSVCVFLFLVDTVCKALRPSGALGLVARQGRDVIIDVYPVRLSESGSVMGEPAGMPIGEPRSTVLTRREGVLLAFDKKGLVTLGERANCLIEMVPQVGDFLTADQPLFRIFGEGVPPVAKLHQSVAVGPERTLQQDPAFAFRIMVDIASKALSPAINDPTSAVLAIDQIERLLRMIGSRHLDSGAIRDSRGTVRLVYRTPDWEDFVHLAVTEIRQFGGASIQVARRLRAMLDGLIRSVPEERVQILRQELSLLDRSSTRHFGEKEDKVMAVVSDSQGVGGREPIVSDAQSSGDGVAAAESSIPQ